MKNIIRKANLRSSLRLMLVLLTVLILIGTAEAATLTVTNANDDGAGSLRRAISDAAAGDTIVFASSMSISLTSGELLIDKDLTITGDVRISGNFASRVFEVSPGVNATLSFLTIQNGLASSRSAGGGINNHGMLTVINCIFTGNTADGGGGAIFNSTGGALTVTGCTLSGNFGGGGSSGGGIYNDGTVIITNSTISNNQGGSGGGIRSNSGTLTVTGCTLSGNLATVAGGGGISNIASTVTLINSTLSANTTHTKGGGIYNFAGGMVTLIHSTLSGNSATSDGGGIYNDGTVNSKNSIAAVSPYAGAGTLNVDGVNYSTDATYTGFTPVPLDGIGGLNLGPLQPNGGPTLTHALLVSSVAIDAVTDCTDLAGNTISSDQRGKPRPADGDSNGSDLCDAGAFEAQPCQITCPANITVSNDPNQCGAVVNYPAPTASGDTCGTITCSPPSGSFFPIGTTTVSCNESGTSTDPDCTFTVTVNDTPPSISCPANITQGTDSGQCSATVTYTTPAATDNCPGATVSCVPASGSTFPLGTSTVTCTATDSSGNTASCSFTVTVNDTQPPSITCPANIVGVEPTSPAGAVVNYSLPTVSDSCPGVGTPSCTPPSGSTFQIGTTTVTCTVSDAAGNSNACSFTVTVLTPAQAIQSLIGRLQALVTAGVLNPTQGTGLIAKLRDALAGLSRGNTRVACNKLADFISQVNALVGSGVLTPAQGEPLVQSATNIRNALGCS